MRRRKNRAPHAVKQTSPRHKSYISRRLGLSDGTDCRNAETFVEKVQTAGKKGHGLRRAITCDGLSYGTKLLLFATLEDGDVIGRDANGYLHVRIDRSAADDGKMQVRLPSDSDDENDPIMVQRSVKAGVYDNLPFWITCDDSEIKRLWDFRNCEWTRYKRSITKI